MIDVTEPVAPHHADVHEFRFPDELGLLWEASTGTPRMAGRILGALLIAEEPYLSGAELAERLHASSGSISTMTRLLETQRVIERFVLPGSRRDYFRVVEQPWRVSLHRAARISERYVALLDRALDELAVEGHPRRERLAELRDFYDFLSEEFPRLVERYEESKRSRDHD